MTNSRQMPKEEGLDHSLTLLREGYMFLANRRKSFASNIFETRLLGQKAICMGGEEAAKLFYDNDKFIRMGAAPKRLQKTLFGVGGVQGLDEEEHRNRKGMFMSIMTPNHLERLNRLTQKYWDIKSREWEQKDQVVLYDESRELLCKLACEWAGVPLNEGEVKKRTEQLTKLFESASALGPEHWMGRHARKELEDWIGELVEQVRNSELQPPEGTALNSFSFHKDIEGKLLDKEIVAVEVLNIIRPIVAISVYITFTGLAVHQYPENKPRLLIEEEFLQMFVQEVRRFYPFFPATIARVKKDFIWNEFQFEEGTLTLLDLYGTNHDPHLWDNPEIFNPDRFAQWDESPFSFIPQGGGDFNMGHRCAGEWVTIEVMKVSLQYLANKLEYDLPNQDLSYSMVSIPSLPHSKVIMANVKSK
ncbi:cytochrome P450 [Psychrobacillus sp. BL-248-WT-3]|uniref:cytochrome P450 n=1 Tax=Psychrobacillus sp. BL-248-WT-3 TaxID=2725306 RepID=UPI00146D4D32|nr:cytochrome P450 [Psychrobacillus sp. BL-248-WT-3]NME06497.1 cytochrome P450 [Psychrobacillus sp. BL-248-WT-3]